MPHQSTVPAHTLLWPIAVTPTCMTGTLSLEIPKVTDNGVLEISRSAWAEIEQIADEEFGVALSIHDHDAPGAYHAQPFVPFTHYLLEVFIEKEAVEAFIKRVDPLIQTLIESHTQQPVVSTGR